MIWEFISYGFVSITIVLFLPFIKFITVSWNVNNVLVGSNMDLKKVSKLTLTIVLKYYIYELLKFTK
jgi:hypothetical protein